VIGWKSAIIYQKFNDSHQRLVATFQKRVEAGMKTRIVLVFAFNEWEMFCYNLMSEGIWSSL
jgi:hypothetical protein